MQLSVDMKDRDGNDLKIGDLIHMYDWGGSHDSIGTAQIVWNSDEGRISTEPCLVEDPYDFWTKAIPRCTKINLRPIQQD